MAEEKKDQGNEQKICVTARRKIQLLETFRGCPSKQDQNIST